MNATPARSRYDAAAAAFAALATFTIAAFLVLIRGSVDQSVIVLLLATVVSACGLLGGRRAGVAAAIMAALSFNFFFTKPYLSLRIHDADDVLTTFTLLVVGLIGGFAAEVLGRRRAQVEDVGSELQSIARVVDLVSDGDEAEDVELAVRAELLSLLHLVDCRFEPGDVPGVPELGRHGSLDTPVLRYRSHGFELPPDGVAIPVLVRGAVVAHLVCVPEPATSVSIDRRRAALVLAGILGTSLAARGG